MTATQASLCFWVINLLVGLDGIPNGNIYELDPSFANIPLAAMIPVAAAPVIDPETPAASPATYRFGMFVCRLRSVFILDDRNFTSGA